MLVGIHAPGTAGGMKEPFPEGLAEQEGPLGFETMLVPEQSMFGQSGKS